MDVYTVQTPTSKKGNAESREVYRQNKKKNIIMRNVVVFLIILVFVGCKTSPIVKVQKTADGRFEQTVSNYYCNMYKNADCFSTFKNDSTDVINGTDICIKCGRKFSEHESTGEHYQKEATDNNWL
jgi:hypothetical protein